MDNAFFENLTADGARAYLDRYLEVEAAEVEATLAKARADGIDADYTVASVPALFEWLGPRLRTEPVDAELPDWLRDAMEQHGGVREFDEESRRLVLRASYYLGQSFVHEVPALEWGLGREDAAEFQQPVVTGFRDSDLPVLVVTANLLGLAGQPEFGERVRRAIATWRAAVGS